MARYFTLGAVLQPLLLAFFLTSCDQDEAETSFQALMQEELSFMVAELQSGAGKEKVRPEPFYVVREYRKLNADSSFETDVVSTVQFYYLRGSTLCQQRTYRHPRMGQGWDRLSKQMMQCDTTLAR